MAYGEGTYTVYNSDGTIDHHRAGSSYLLRPGETTGVVLTSSSGGVNSFAYDQATYPGIGTDIYVGGVKVGGYNPFDTYTTTPVCQSHELQDAVLSADGEAVEGNCVSCGSHIAVHRIPGGMPVLELEQLLLRMDNEPVGSDELVEAFVDAAEKLIEERRKLESAELVLELARQELTRRVATT